MSTPTEARSEVRFRSGKPHVTVAATAALELAKVSDLQLLARHLHGDWGDVNEQDRLQNELAVLLDMRILSRYPLPTGSVIWVITEANRATTTFVLMEED